MALDPFYPNSLIKVGGLVSASTAGLRIIGDALEPEEITHLLRCSPSESRRLGDLIIGKKTGQQRLAKTGIWRLQVEDRKPANIDAQIEEILDQLTKDIAVWSNLASRFKMDLFCGLFLNSSNEGVGISPLSMVELGKRGIELGFDIYGPAFDDELERHFATAQSKLGKPTH
jgi:Domain of unknown function (DUF4279)